MRLLVLRPEPGATATAARAKGVGCEAIIAPLFSIQTVAWEVPDPTAHDALLLTSANAVRHAGEGLVRLASLPAFAVGSATARAAQEAGLRVVNVGSGDAVEIVKHLALAGYCRPLHLTGADHRAVDHRGVCVTRVIVYRAGAVVELPAVALRPLQAGAVALLHSPRAAALFAQLLAPLGELKAGVRLAVISDAARIAAGEGWRAVAVAARPTDDALLAAAATLCETRAGPADRTGQ